MMKFTLSLLFAVLSCVSFSVAASNKYVCDNHGDKRVIKIAYQSEHESMPCEVIYDKGQGEEVLWNAQSESGYCQAKANEFLEKQESWGYNCSEFKVPVVARDESQIESGSEMNAESTKDMSADLQSSAY